MPKAARTAKRAEQPDPVITAALTLAAERGWRRVSLLDIARAAKLSLAELYQAYRSKGAILGAFVRHVDAAVLAQGEAEGDKARDRLFDVLMRRFETLRPHKAAIEAILRDAGADPFGALCGAPRLLRSMAWMLEAAGLASHGLRGLVRAKGLALVYLGTMRVWLSDDTADLSRTMAALDKRLNRIESVIGLCPALRRRGARGAASEASAA